MTPQTIYRYLKQWAGTGNFRWVELLANGWEDAYLEESGGGKLTYEQTSGVTIEMLKVVAGSQSVTSGTFVDLTNIAGSFNAPVAGIYLIELQIVGVVGSSAQYGRFRAVFDASGTPQYIGANDVYSQIWMNSSIRARGTIRGTVNLTAGTHTIKIQALKAVGTAVNTDAETSFRVDGTFVSGSGAGGTINTTRNFVTGATTTSASWATVNDGSEVSVSVTAATGELVFWTGKLDIYCTGSWAQGSVGIGIDGADPVQYAECGSAGVDPPVSGS